MDGLKGREVKGSDEIRAITNEPLSSMSFCSAGPPGCDILTCCCGFVDVRSKCNYYFEYWDVSVDGKEAGFMYVKSGAIKDDRRGGAGELFVALHGHQRT